MRLWPWDTGAKRFADRAPGAREDAPSTEEIGTTAGGEYTANLMRDYNPDLHGQQALRTYDKMRRSDAQVRGTLRLVKAPIISAQWYVQPASDSPLDIEVAEFVEWNLHNMSRTWTQILNEALLMMDFGFYAFEKVWEWGEWRPKDSTRGPKRAVIKWKKLAPRHPMSIDHWEFDEHGGVRGVWQNVLGNGGSSALKFISIRDLLLFTLDEEAGNPEGMSILRSAYQHYYYKSNLYKIDAIQKERHGIGVPDIQLPMNFKPADKRAAEVLGRNLRTNERAFIVRPPGWTIGFTKLEGQLVDALKSAEHHDLLIARNVLAQFINIGGDTSGSRATASEMTTIFWRSLRYIGELIAGVLNQYAIKQLVDYNFSVDQYPTLKVRRIGDSADWRAFSVAYRNFIESNGITPTPEDEAWLRDQIDMPGAPQAARDRAVDSRVKPVASPVGDTSNRVPKPADGG